MVDEAMRRALVHLYPRLRSFALRLAGSPADADDLVQHACERALAFDHRWKPGTRLDSWLYRIIQNCWCDEKKSARTRFQTSLDDAANLFADDGERVVDSRLILEATCRELHHLSTEQRIVLILVCIIGLPYREVAAILDVPIGTVMSRLARARLALARRIDTAASKAPADN
ncbi:RNA polymerase sigma-70 factor (ECF subfamily) [Skermanella aerolata]|uniref:RNA polymerase sigma factor n=1 Tax=Skermanella aerolata TaxID=393310 RepID=UPI003D1C952A